jgi:hypothetical protein
MVQSDLGGFKVCGKRAGFNFLDVARPVSISNGSKYECPEGSFACDPEAEPNDMLCYTDLELCPITNIHLSFSKDLLLDHGQDELLVNHRENPERNEEKWIYLSWSKQGKNLPITST